ncbi:MAG TPA: PilT/PilU family type 4a pilus ATPase [Candidatus Lachnoclostridium stercoripullorum]|uniref:PilT/PilU family type 4a pilus ATPase n=1 Tax=Candidatus Lachnoclostridium stercoripullorum TaxID=2838635 RepID=A0A9D1W571_9FIRM|nr:PilT/PilU family type 4a pilus ATPase [Candidatus Lachnoclostridium stercoripullorum]
MSEERIEEKSSELNALLTAAVNQDASDIFLIPGMPAAFKIHGQIEPIDERKILPGEMDHFIRAIYALTGGRDMERVLRTGDDDFSFSIQGLSRFRASVMKQRGSLAAVIRLVRFDLPSPENLHIPESIMKLSQLPRGLVLVTGPAGSGKSTTLACIIDRINRTRNAHVITLEDPIEFLHRHQKSVVTQREIGLDTDSYVDGLRAALRQAPDVILLGEMRDYETIRIAMTAAETGHLVISTLHTTGAANTIDRIIDIFPANAQQQIRVQLSMVLQAVVSQQLVPTTDGLLRPAFELMLLTKAIRNLIRESKIQQIDSIIASGGAQGMMTMDGSLRQLWSEGVISADTAITYSQDSERMKNMVR